MTLLIDDRYPDSNQVTFLICMSGSFQHSRLIPQLFVKNVGTTRIHDYVEGTSFLQIRNSQFAKQYVVQLSGCTGILITPRKFIQGEAILTVSITAASCKELLVNITYFLVLFCLIFDIWGQGMYLHSYTVYFGTILPLLPSFMQSFRSYPWLFLVYLMSNSFCKGLRRWLML